MSIVFTLPIILNGSIKNKTVFANNLAVLNFFITIKEHVEEVFRFILGTVFTSFCYVVVIVNRYTINQSP